MINLRNGLAPPEWASQPGPMLLSRPGGLPLAEGDVDCMNEYMSVLLDRYGDWGDCARAEASITPEDFRIFKRGLVEERAANGMPLEGLNC